MATRTADIHIRIEPEIKNGAEAIFSELGVTASDVVTSIYDYVYSHRRLPAKIAKRSPHILNLSTASASEIKAALNDSRTFARNGHTKTVAESKAEFKRRHNLA